MGASDHKTTNEGQKEKRPIGKAVGIAVEVGVIVSLLLIQFRLLTICLIAVFAVFFIFLRRFRRRQWLIPASVVVAVSMILPFDVAVGSFHYGSRRGASPGGPHLVEFVVGMPMHTRLIERYGEYISGGCTWSVFYPPKWILVWN